MLEDLQSFKETLDKEMNTFLTKEISHYKEISSQPDITGLLEQLTAVSSGGKRIRPFLVWILYSKNTPQAKIADILPLLLAIEFFHIFCLIHDDVMDEAEERHGQPTIHSYAFSRYYQNSDGKKCRRISDNQAILIGDILFNSVFKLLRQFRLLQPKNFDEIESVFMQLVDEVCIGQMIDVHLTALPQAAIETIQEKNRLKTAMYSFARPLHLGTLVAERKDLSTVAVELGILLGQFYQIQDDLLDVVGDVNKIKKPLLQDVIQNQHTILSAHIRKHAPEGAAVLNSYAGKNLSPADISELQKLFNDSGAITYAEETLTHHESEIASLIQKSNLSESDALLFTDILQLMHKRIT